ncbi:MAG: hypothetical protein EOL86_14275 [Deltaproteobacteria bacterium]|nr:hypothetical protein [Deltaproteobacteria bacterium]
MTIFQYLGVGTIVRSATDSPAWADALALDHSPRATAHLPMDLSVAVTDMMTVQIDGTPATGIVTAVEHVVRSGQALTRVEMVV